MSCAKFLSDHVPIFVWEQNEISIEYELRWKRRSWNGSLVERFEEVGGQWVSWLITMTSHERDGVSNYRQLDCLFNIFFGLTAMKIPKLSISVPLWCINDVIIGAITSQITSLTIVFSTVYLDIDQRKHQKLRVTGLVRGIHRRPVNSPHKWPVTREMFPFDDVIMGFSNWWIPSVSMSWCHHAFGRNSLLATVTYRQTSNLSLALDRI